MTPSPSTCPPRIRPPAGGTTPTPSSRWSANATKSSLSATRLAAFTAPLVCARRPVDHLVLLAAMIPAPGELFARLVEERRLRGERLRRPLLPRRPARPGGRSPGAGARAGGQAAPGALAARRLARTCRRATSSAATTACSRRVGASPRPRAARHRGRRDGRRALRLAQPAARASRAAGRLPTGCVGTRPNAARAGSGSRRPTRSGSGRARRLRAPRRRSRQVEPHP